MNTVKITNKVTEGRLTTQIYRDVKAKYIVYFIYYNIARNVKILKKYSISCQNNIGKQVMFGNTEMVLILPSLSNVVDS